MTNFGVLDAVVRPAYPIPAPAPALQVAALYFHSVMFYRPHTLLPLILHAWTWQGVLTYAWSYSPAHMGAVDERQLEGRFVGRAGGITHAVGNAGAAVRGSTRDGEAGAAEREGDEKVLGRFILELERIMMMIAEGGEAPSSRTRL